MASGKDNPFGDGTSGASGNGGGGGFPGMKGQRGPDRPQKSGPPDFNADSVPAGGRVLKLDPPSDRQGLVTQTAEGGMKHKPFKVGGKGPAMPKDNASVDTGIEGTVGDIPTEDSGD